MKTERAKLTSNIISVLSLMMLLAVSLSCAAKDAIQAAIVMSSSASVYKTVANTIEENKKLNVEFTQIDLSASNFVPDYPSVYITVGTQAFQKLLSERPDSTIIASFIPRRNYEQLLTQSQKADTTAIFVDQPMSRQVKLARLIAPNAKTIGTVFGESSIEEKKLLYESANQEGFTILSNNLKEQDNPIGILQPIITNSDIFLALPDQSVFNKATAKWSLYITLHNKKPMIGFSEKYVDAGALAAVYSTPEQIGRDTQTALSNYIENRKLPEAHHPSTFLVKINTASARSLNITIPSEETLMRKIKGAE